MTRALILSALLLAPLSSAQAGPGHHEREAKSQEDRAHPTRDKKQMIEERVFAMIAKHGDELGLDEKAQEAIREIVDRHKEQGEKLKEELKTAHEDLKSLMEEASDDLDSILVQADVITSLKGELFKQHLTTLVQLREHLSEEQIRQIKEKVVHRMQHRQGNGHSHKAP